MSHPLTGIPQQINTGTWLTGYSLEELRRRIPGERVILPICSLGTPLSQLAELGPFVLPPLFHEAMNPPLKDRLLSRIHKCFPLFRFDGKTPAFDFEIEIRELPPERIPAETLPGWRGQPQIAAFSVDTAVEEHGPHLPLATDTIQSYAVLDRLAAKFDGLLTAPPLEYGHLTWGLPFGFSIDVTPVLLTEYVTGFADAILEWLSPRALYVVDVHGSIVHRNAICAGLEQSRCADWKFRWLHEPLVEFAGDRGDQHAGGVETVLVEHINPKLVSPDWWPNRADELAAGQMSLETAVELSADLRRFVRVVEEGGVYNGIVGRIENAFELNAADLMDRMLHIAETDVSQLLDAMP